MTDTLKLDDGSWGRESGYREDRGTRLSSGTEAVELYRASGKSIRDIATELGISPESLRRWAILQDVDAGNRKCPTTDDREELSRLRKENYRLKMEREILREFVGFARSPTCVRIPAEMKSRA